MRPWGLQSKIQRSHIVDCRSGYTETNAVTLSHYPTCYSISSQLWHQLPSSHDSTHSLSLASCTTGTLLFLALAALLLRIQHHAQNVETKLRELQAHALEFVLCFVSQHMTTLGPECSDRLSNVLVVGARLFVHKTRVCYLALGSGFREVDFPMSCCRESWKAEALC
jgi:hypothetical protein